MSSRAQHVPVVPDGIEFNAAVAACPERPFVGLRPFGFADRDYFFGRDGQVAAVRTLLDRRRFCAIIGSSGSGKSSLVRAGLLKALAHERDRRWIWAECNPGTSPLRNLADALAGIRGRGPEGPGHDEHAEARRDRIELLLESSSLGLVEALPLVPDRSERTLLLIVDQFEELFRFADVKGFSLADPRALSSRREAATLFVDLLLEAARNPELPLRIIITMRSDYIGDCGRFAGLAEAVSEGQYLVPSLARRDLEAVICAPVEKAGARIEPALVQRLLIDAGDAPDQLPVLQHVLMRCWFLARRRTAGAGLGTIGVEDALAASEQDASSPATVELLPKDYEDTGKLEKALSRHADEVLSSLTDPHRGGQPELGRVVETIFRALTDLDQQGRATRRPQTLDQLVALFLLEGANAAVRKEKREQVCTVLDHFRHPDTSFLRPPKPEPLRDDGVVDIGHEALFRVWEQVSGTPSRQGWLEAEARDGRRYRALLELLPGRLASKATSEWLEWWNERPRTPGWADRYGDRLHDVTAMLDESRSHVLKGERRQKWTRGAAFSLLFVVALGGSLLFAERRNQEALKARSKALQTQLDSLVSILERSSRGGLAGEGSPAVENLPPDTDPRQAQVNAAVGRLADAARLNIEATASVRSLVVASAADEALGKAGPATALLLALEVLEGKGGLTPVPQAEMAAYAALRSLRELRQVLITGEVSNWNYAVHPDGQLMLLPGPGGTAVLTDLETGARILELQVGGTLSTVAFHPAGGIIATGTVEGTVQLWDLISNGPPVTLVPGTAEVRFIAFSPDGSRLVSGDESGSASVWDVASAKRRLQLLPDEPQREIHAAAFSPDGTLLALGGSNAGNESTGQVRIRNLSGGPPIPSLSTGRPEEEVNGLAFDNTGQLVGVSSEGRLIVWPNILAPPQFVNLTDSALFGITSTRDFSLFATAAGSGDIFLLRAARGVLDVMPGHRSDAAALGFSPDGSRLVTLSIDQTARLWRVDRSALPERGSQGGIDELPPLQEMREAGTAQAGSGNREELTNHSKLSLRAILDQNGRIPLVRVEGDREPFALSLPPEVVGVTGAAFSPTGDRLLVVPTTGPLLLYDLAEPSAPIARFGHRGDSWRAVAYRPGDKIVALHGGVPFPTDTIIGVLRDEATFAWPVLRSRADLLAFGRDSLPRVGDVPLSLNPEERCAYRVDPDKVCQQ